MSRLSSSSHCSTDLREVFLSHLHLLLHQPPPVGRLVLKPPLGLLSPPPLLLQHLPPSLHLPLLGASGQGNEEQTQRRNNNGRGKRETGKYVNGRQILQNKAGDCQKTQENWSPNPGFCKISPFSLCVHGGELCWCKMILCSFQTLTHRPALFQHKDENTKINKMFYGFISPYLKLAVHFDVSRFKSKFHPLYSQRREIKFLLFSRIEWKNHSFYLNVKQSNCDR